MRRVMSVLISIMVVGVCSAAPTEFVVNGTFEGGFIPSGTSHAFDLGADSVPVGWTRFETFMGGGPELSTISPFAGSGPSAPGAWSTHFMRMQGGASGDWTTIQQALNINAANYTSLTLSLDTMALYHDLVAGGWVAPAFEWPVVVEIDYTATDGSGQIWRYGWYLTPPGDGPPGPINDPGYRLIPVYNDMAVVAGVWYANSFNLFNELPQVQTITNIRVGSSGWSYEGVVDNVSIIGVPIPAPGAILLAGIGAGAVGWLRKRRLLEK